MYLKPKFFWLLIPIALSCEKRQDDINNNDSSPKQLSMKVSGDTSFTLSGDAFLVDEFRANERRMLIRKTWRDDSLSGRLSFFSPQETFQGHSFPISSGNKDSLEVVFYFNLTPTSKIVGYEGSALVTHENKSASTMSGEFDIHAIRQPQNDTVHVTGNFNASY